MGIVNKVNTFTGAAAPQLPWLDTELDNLRAEFNGNIENANIKALAGIDQSKITNLATDLATKLSDTGDTITGELKSKYANPAYRLTGTEAGAKDWRIVEDAGSIRIQENTGTEDTPAWITRYDVPAGAGGPTIGTHLATKTYVDTLVAALTSGLAFAEATTGANFTETTGSFVDVTGMSVGITTGSRRARVTILASVAATADTWALEVQVDGVTSPVGVLEDGWSNANKHNSSFSFVTSVLTAAAHTIKLRAKRGSSGTMTIFAPASIQVEELPR